MHDSDDASQYKYMLGRNIAIYVRHKSTPVQFSNGSQVACSAAGVAASTQVCLYTAAVAAAVEVLIPSTTLTWSAASCAQCDTYNS
jgi:hypothetical protein